MEDEKDEMSIFNSDMELNYSDFMIPEEIQEDNDNVNNDS